MAQSAKAIAAKKAQTIVTEVELNDQETIEVLEEDSEVEDFDDANDQESENVSPVFVIMVNMDSSHGFGFNLEATIGADNSDSAKDIFMSMLTAKVKKAILPETLSVTDITPLTRPILRTETCEDDTTLVVNQQTGFIDDGDLDANLEDSNDGYFEEDTVKTLSGKKVAYLRQI